MASSAFSFRSKTIPLSCFFNVETIEVQNEHIFVNKKLQGCMLKLHVNSFASTLFHSMIKISSTNLSTSL